MDSPIQLCLPVLHTLGISPLLTLLKLHTQEYQYSLVYFNSLFPCLLHYHDKIIALVNCNPSSISTWLISFYDHVCKENLVSSGSHTAEDHFTSSQTLNTTSSIPTQAGDFASHVILKTICSPEIHHIILPVLCLFSTSDEYIQMLIWYLPFKGNIWV